VPTSADVVKELAITSTCSSIIIAIDNDCETLEDVRKYVVELMDEAKLKPSKGE
jgi:hypothetical protein